MVIALKKRSPPRLVAMEAMRVGKGRIVLHHDRGSPVLPIPLSRWALVQSLSQPTPSSSASKSNGSGGLTEIGPSTYSGPFPEPPAQS
jgi:hypothetical protein